MIRTARECDVIDCNGVFQHIGGEQSVARPALRRAMSDGSSLDWVLYDTPLAKQLELAMATKQKNNAV
jgi:hypothetical protein